MAKTDLRIGPVEVGNTRITIKCNEYTFDKVVELREAVADIRRNHSIFAKYPMEEGETKEKWRVRVEPIMEADLTRKEDEPLTDHLKRMFELKSDTHEMALDVLNAICTVFGLRVVSEEDFKKANWIDVKALIFDVLDLGDIPAADFAPRRM